jgi:hypothetical protein
VRHELRSHREARSALAGLRDLPDPPTALFTSNDLITMGVLDSLDHPSPVAIVGFDDLPLAERLSPPPTVVSQDPVALGATAANLLFARIGGDRSAPRSVGAALGGAAHPVRGARLRRSNDLGRRWCRPAGDPNGGRVPRCSKDIGVSPRCGRSAGWG